jgi:hypothetical protein
MKVQPSMTPPQQPLQPNANAPMMAAANPPSLPSTPAPSLTVPNKPQMAAANPPQIQSPLIPPSIPGAPPALPTPPPSFPSLPPPVVQSGAQAQLGKDMADYQRKKDSGAGVDQIKNKPLRVLGKIGDIAASVLAPGVSTFLPGTTLHHDALLNRDQQAIGRDQEAITTQQTQLKDAADLAHTEAETAAIPINAGQKRQTYLAALAGKGLKEDDKGNIVPDETSPEYQKQQAQTDYFNSRSEAASAQADLNKSKNDPRSPLFQQAQARLRVAQQNAQNALNQLGLSRDQFNMHAYNTGPDGQVLPGAMIGDDGTAVGTANASNVRPTATQRDAAGRADVADSLRTNILTQLQDPEVREAFGPLNGRITEAKIKLGTASPKVAKAYNDLVSYGAFQAGMHPVRGIGALQYFDKVNGGLGQTPEQLEGKLSSGQGVMKDVTAIGTPNVKGGRNQPSIPARNAMVPPQIKDGTTKKNAAGDTVVFRKGAWGPA